MTIKQLFKTAPLTTLLLISFIGLYIMQVLTGVDANSPSTEALLHWGANALPFSMVEQPWRLVSSGFLHIGLMHLLFNGFAMYFFGQIAEPMFGSGKFLALFLLAVIGGNLLNNQMTWLGILDGTGQPGLSAGASGGIMGIGAALLVAALFKISVNGMVLNLKSLVLIMGINLVYGFAVPGIDNAGHIGGAITGAMIALSIGAANRQRLKAQQAVIPIYRTKYVNYQADTTINNAINTDEPSIYANNNDHNPVNLNNPTNIHDQFEDKYSTQLSDYDDVTDNFTDSSYETNSIANTNGTAATAARIVKPTKIWQLLPWIITLLIAIGFTWWWLDIHNQILQVLATQ